MTDTIKAVAEAIANNSTKGWEAEAKAAIEAMQIREMTVEEVAKVLRIAIDVWDRESDTFNQWTDLSSDEMMDVYAKALAKLGTIKIVGDV